MSKAIIGQQRVIREILIAFLAGGHCLLRGVPGNYTRVSSEATWKRTLIDSWGQMFTPFVSLRADAAAVNVTGQTGVANYILQMARAVTLLGSRVILVGIGAEIAQTIVQLGVDLRDMTTLANFQAGIAHALALQGFAIQPTGKVAQAVETA